MFISVCIAFLHFLLQIVITDYLLFEFNNIIIPNLLVIITIFVNIFFIKFDDKSSYIITFFIPIIVLIYPISVWLELTNSISEITYNFFTKLNMNLIYNLFLALTFI